MKCIFAGIVFCGLVPGQTVSPSRPTPSNSIEQQRASVLKQVTAITGKTAAPGSFFTVPWVDSIASRPLPPPCDPMATAELEQLIEQNSKQHGVKSDLIRAVINQESGNRPCAVSSKGAQGLMQLMPATADELGVADPFNAKENVEAGTRLLKQLLAKYNGDVSLTLAAYNAGAGRVDRDGGVPAIPETLSYVTQILAKLPKR
ncbi:MAG TPA: lytic transglycosylase domain-containing protein [Bryobacteraceae bacterium]|nr:lytic transglycosylase domain-containing protein [Bryobacteraceae bacterium]